MWLKRCKPRLIIRSYSLLKQFFHGICWQFKSSGCFLMIFNSTSSKALVLYRVFLHDYRLLNPPVHIRHSACLLRLFTHSTYAFKFDITFSRNMLSNEFKQAIKPYSVLMYAPQRLRGALQCGETLEAIKDELCVQSSAAQQNHQDTCSVTAFLQQVLSCPPYSC